MYNESYYPFCITGQEITLTSDGRERCISLYSVRSTDKSGLQVNLWSGHIIMKTIGTPSSPVKTDWYSYLNIQGEFSFVHQRFSLMVRRVWWIHSVYSIWSLAVLVSGNRTDVPIWSNWQVSEANQGISEEGEMKYSTSLSLTFQLYLQTPGHCNVFSTMCVPIVIEFLFMQVVGRKPSCIWCYSTLRSQLRGTM